MAVSLLEVFHTHWFTLLQSLGIVGSLLFTAKTIRDDNRSRQATTFLTITRYHREAWDRLLHRPDLKRVIDSKANISRVPITSDEHMFVLTLIAHLAGVHRAIRLGQLPTLEGIGRDIAVFFALPIPRKVWQEVRSAQDSAFVAFVEHRMAKETSPVPRRQAAQRRWHS